MRLQGIGFDAVWTTLPRPAGPARWTAREAAFKTDLEKLLKTEGHMPEDKFLVMSRKGKRLGVAYASTPRGEGARGSLKWDRRDDASFFVRRR